MLGIQHAICALCSAMDCRCGRKGYTICWSMQAVARPRARWLAGEGACCPVDPAVELLTTPRSGFEYGHQPHKVPF